MAILTRRALQALIGEAPIRSDLLKGLVHRLNQLDKSSLAAEWELIVLSALSRVGLVEYEPGLGGAANLDIQFRDSSGLLLTGDIATLSDDDAVQKNPVDRLAAELHRRVDKRGIRGGFDIAISSVAGMPTSRGQAISLAIPPVHRWPSEIFNAGNS